MRLIRHNAWEHTWDPSILLQIMDDGNAALGVDVKEPAMDMHMHALEGPRHLWKQIMSGSANTTVNISPGEVVNL
jgi:hypothetical protein